MSDIIDHKEFDPPKIETLIEHLKQLEPVGFDSEGFKTTISSVKWELDNIKQPDETIAQFLKRSSNNGVRLLYTSNKYKPIFKEESEFGITEGSVDDFFVEITSHNVADMIRKIRNKEEVDSQSIPLEELTTKAGGRYKIKDVNEEDHNLRITNFEIPTDKIPNVKVHARIVQSKPKNEGEFKTQSEILFVKIPCKDFAEYLQN